ncbi:MAG: hypothetical protein ABIJ84_04135 [bacterium]
MQKKNKFLKYFIIVGVVVAVAFLSQQVNLVGREKTFTFVNDSVSQAKIYAAIGTDWLTDKVLPNIRGEVQKRGEMVAQGVTEQVNDQKEKVTESVTTKIKNYFSGITDSILHPGENNCECQSQSSSD